MKAPDNHKECGNGGYFLCRDCNKYGDSKDYGCDRDVVGSVNVGRKYLSNSRNIEKAKPSDYMSGGDYAGFSELEIESSSHRSSGVSSTATEETEQLKNQHHPLDTMPLPVVKHSGGADGTQKNGRNKRWSASRENSISRHVVQAVGRTENY